MENRRVWKAGALAVVATIAFAIFAFRVEEWSKGFESEFLVYGQTQVPGGSGGGSGGSGTGSGTSTVRVIPHVPVGSFDGNLTRYLTVIQVVNTGTASVNVTADFYNTGTGADSTLQMTRSGASGTTTFARGFASEALESNGVMVITADNSPNYTAEWARISANGNIAVSAYFELRDGGPTNILYTRVGVAASPEDRQSFVIPRVVDVARGLDVGFAVLNTGATSANLTGTLRGARGTTMASCTITLEPRKQRAIFARQFFADAGCSTRLGTEATGTNYGTIVFTSTSRQFAAAALAIEGASLSSFPIETIQ